MTGLTGVYWFYGPLCKVVMGFRLTWLTFWNLGIVYLFLIFRAQGCIDWAAKNAGFINLIEISLAREEINKNGPTMIAINTDQQLRLGLPSIINGSGSIQGIAILIVTFVTFVTF